MPDKEQRTEIPDGLGYNIEEGGEEEVSAPETVETELDPLDELASEMDSETTKSGEEDKFDQDLGWEDDSEEEEQEEEAAESDDDEGEKEEEDPDPDEKEEEDDTDKAEEEQEEVEGEKEEEQEEEPEDLYDAKRDFPDSDLPPTTYKDRVSLNNGVVAKINYGRDLLNKLKEELGSDVGAIDLPSMFEGNPDFVKNPFDRTNYVEKDDELAKQDVKELDQFINDVKGKISRVETEVNSQQEVSEVQQEWDDAVTNLSKAVNTLGLDPKKAQDMTYDQLIQESDKLINEYLEGETGEDLAADKGLKAVNEKIDEIRAAKGDIEKIPQAYERYNKLKDTKEESKSKLPDPETMTEAYDEWAKDQPSLPIHKHSDMTGELKKAFMEFVKVQINSNPESAPQSPRDWHKQYKSYQDAVQKEKAKYEKSRKKSAPKTTEDANSMQADKNKRKPNPRRVKSEDSFSRHGLKSSNLDSELDQLASELDNN